jgi:hypothetical protein
MAQKALLLYRMAVLHIYEYVIHNKVFLTFVLEGTVQFHEFVSLRKYKLS